MKHMSMYRGRFLLLSIFLVGSLILTEAKAKAASGDFDGDGRTDLAVYQEATGHWFFVRSTLGFGQHLNFGGSNFLPVPGDYDGDGQTDVAVYQTSTGNWFMVGSTSGFTSHLAFGGAGFVPVPGDYDGDGRTDVAVYQASTGELVYGRFHVGIHESFSIWRIGVYSCAWGL